MIRCSELIKGLVPMIVGTGAVRTEDSVMFAQAAKAAGANALLVATPPYAYPTRREIALHALAVDRAANLPVMWYNYPGRMSVNMDEETLGRSPNFLRHQGKQWLHQSRAYVGAGLSAYRFVMRYG